MKTPLNITQVELDELLEDKKRLDFLQSQGGGRRWVSRPSSTGRGYRVYTGSSRRTSKTVREAIDVDRALVTTGRHIHERQQADEEGNQS